MKHIGRGQIGWMQYPSSPPLTILALLGMLIWIGCCTEWFASMGYIYMCASIVPFGLVPLAIPIPMVVPYPILVHKS
jgi:hypothetical protein